MIAAVDLTQPVYEQTWSREEEAFACLNKARNWLAERGFSVGTMCGGEPMGVMKGDYDIAKWRNCSARERAGFDGTLTGPDFRYGPIHLRLRVDPEAGQ